MMRYCVECGTPFEVTGAGRPPIRCPEHRTRPLLSEVRADRRCRECGAAFINNKPGKPYLYCEEHRGTINSARRSEARRGISRRPGWRQTHVCDERCPQIEQMIQQVPTPTLQAMGDRFGLTRERIRQIINLHGWNKKRSHFGGWNCTTCREKVVGQSKEQHLASLAHERAKVQRRAEMGDRRKRWDLGAMIYALWEAGYKPREIAYLADTYPLAPYRWLLALGIDPYAYPGAHGPNDRLSPERAAVRDRQVALAWAEGTDTETIMETFDIATIGNLYRIIKEKGAKRPEWWREERQGWAGYRRKQAQEQADAVELSDKA